MRKLNFLILLLSISSIACAQQTLSLEDCRKMAVASNKSVQMAEQSIIAAEEMKKAAFANFFPNISGIASYTYNQKNISLLGEDGMLPVGFKMPDGSFGPGITPTSKPSFNADGSFKFPESAINNNFRLVNGKPVPLDAQGKPFDPAKNPENLLWKNYAFLPKDAMEMDMHNIFAGGINLTQPIYLGGKIREMYNLASYSKQMTEAQKDTKILDLLVAVDEAYWRVVSLENKVKLANEYRNLVAKFDTNMTAMIAEGVATKAEGLKIKVKLNEAEISVIKAEDGLRLSRMALNQLCGLPLRSEPALSDQNLNTITLVAQTQDVQKALLNRSEIKTLMQLENIAKTNERLMKSRFMPNIAFTGNYLVTNPNSYNGFEKNFAGNFTAGVILQVPIFHYFERSHTLKAAQVATKMAGLQLEEAKEKMELQVAMNQNKIEESLKKQISTKKNIEQAEENLRYANEGFEAGTIPSTDLLAAQTAWLTAKSEYIDASIDVKLADVYLKKSLGQIQVPVIEKEPQGNKKVK